MIGYNRSKLFLRACHFPEILDTSSAGGLRRRKKPSSYPVEVANFGAEAAIIPAPAPCRAQCRNDYFDYFFFAMLTAEIGALDLATASLCCLSVEACCFERSFDFGDLSPMHITPLHWCRDDARALARPCPWIFQVAVGRGNVTPPPATAGVLCVFESVAGPMDWRNSATKPPCRHWSGHCRQRPSKRPDWLRHKLSRNCVHPTKHTGRNEPQQGSLAGE